MQVILKQDVKGLGKKNALINVSDGYAKNFLIPRGVAIEATSGNVTDLKCKQQAQDEKKARELALAKEEAAKLAGKTIEMSVKCGENGKLFGAIAPKDISEAIEKQLKLKVDKKKFNLSEPIKQLGTFDVTARIAPGVTSDFKVNVTAGK